MFCGKLKASTQTLMGIGLSLLMPEKFFHYQIKCNIQMNSNKCVSKNKIPDNHLKKELNLNHLMIVCRKWLRWLRSPGLSPPPRLQPRMGIRCLRSHCDWEATMIWTSLSSPEPICTLEPFVLYSFLSSHYSVLKFWIYKTSCEWNGFNHLTYLSPKPTW